jgi:hypothetical protein
MEMNLIKHGVLYLQVDILQIILNYLFLIVGEKLFGNQITLKENGMEHIIKNHVQKVFILG